jgi:hypothetical protein
MSQLNVTRQQSPNADFVVQSAQAKQVSLVGAPRPVVRSTADLAQLIEWTRQNDIARSNRDPRAAQTSDVFSGTC